MAIEDTADLAAMFDPDEFAVAATYRAAGTGAGVSKNVIFDRAWLEQLGIASGAAPAALVIATDFTDVVFGTSTIVINSSTYRITDQQAQDDGATALLILAANA